MGGLAGRCSTNTEAHVTVNDPFECVQTGTERISRKRTHAGAHEEQGVYSERIRTEPL
jgi:hypothetical protein